MPAGKGKAWDEVELAEGHTERAPVVKCNHCGFVIRGSITRITGHLLSKPNAGVRGCPNVPDSVKRRLQQVDDERERVQRR